MHNLNNFVLMISLSRLKNAVDKNFSELKNKNIINVHINSNIAEIIKNNIQELNKELNEELNEEINIKKNNSQISIQEQNDHQYEESNFLFNSFIHVADSFKFDSEDWYLIYDDTNMNTNKIKNK